MDNRLGSELIDARLPGRDRWSNRLFACLDLSNRAVIAQSWEKAAVRQLRRAWGPAILPRRAAVARGVGGWLAQSSHRGELQDKAREEHVTESFHGTSLKPLLYALFT